VERASESAGQTCPCVRVHMILIPNSYVPGRLPLI
jgi:hypothetical protein